MKKLFLISAALIAAVSAGAQQLRTLPLSEIEARGWMQKQMLRDITSGYISVYDQIQPTMQVDVFGSQKIKYSKRPNGDWETHAASWWPGEHEGYFTDAVVRNAFLTGYKPWIDKARKFLDHVLATQAQDPTGYIGVYDPICRFDKTVIDNGELWTQSRILGALLAFYEYSGEKKYLDAVRKAADCTIAAYSAPGKTYFQQPKFNGGGGLTHGLMYCEPMEWLTRLTGDKKYLDFALWLYKDYSAAKPEMKNIDCQLANLLDRQRMFQEHSVHVCEHMRVIFWLATATGDKELRQAVDNIFYKYDRSETPTGVIVTDPVVHESVVGNYGSGYLPYEYCSIVESEISFASAMQKFGWASLGDRIEDLAFNAGQGARLPDGKAISYLTPDNRRNALFADDFRCQMGACHRVACCNLQAAKLMPYYVANMWMKSADSRTLYATLLGPSAVNTAIGAGAGVKVHVEEQTLYPFDNKVVFVLDPAQDATFDLAVRNPAWSLATRVDAPDATHKTVDGFIVLSKKWHTGDRVEITFDDHVQLRRFMDNECYVTKGALIYAEKLDETMTPTQTFINALANYDVTPKDDAKARTLFEQTRMPANPAMALAKDSTLYTYRANPQASADYPFDTPYGFIDGQTVDANHKSTTATFVPMGSAVLRKVTFKEDK